ncbi:MAG: glycosyltransferase family 2 protein [Akkermansia sp.]
MTEPLISVIVPVYKVEPYLRAALDSLLQQTLTDWEAVCVDDGSPDASGSILDEYARADSRFRVIHQANGGVSRARNVALDAARGRYVTMMDPDDALPPRALEALYRPCRHDAFIDLIYGRVLWMRDDEVMWHAPALNGGSEADLGLFTDRTFLVRVAPGGPRGILMRRSLLENPPLRFHEKYRYGEDHEFNLRLIIRSRRFCAIDDLVAYYYIRGSSVMRSFESGVVSSATYIDFPCCKVALCAQLPLSWSREERIGCARGLVFFFWRDWARSLSGAGRAGVFKMLRVACVSLSRGLQEARPLIGFCSFFDVARNEADKAFSAAPRLFRTPARYVLYQALRACYRQLRRMVFPPQGSC